MYKIGELATKASVSTDTLRYYEKHGLLKPAGRSGSGYRIYSHSDLIRMRFIIRAKKVGFSLSEIKELLSIEVDKQSHSCADVKTLTLNKLTLVQIKIAELKRFEQSLQFLADACCGTEELATQCSILTALEQDDDISTRNG